jgi:formylglycine-generating enzyme required for sulfatase activity
LFVFIVVAILVAIIVDSAQAGPVSIALAQVGDQGNAGDSRMMVDGTSGYGAVSYVYQIGKYDVTASQYAAFLNSVAATDPYGLYNPSMATGFAATGIIQNGTWGNYNYSVIAGHENFPVNYVTWGDAGRFVNWLQNGQPTGSEGPGTTETGSYTLNGAMSYSDLMAITRNSGANWVIPNENEWYKSAYYKGGGLNAGYWLYPTRSDLEPSTDLSATGTNNLNADYRGGYTDPTNYLTSVGAFAASPGPYGTFDQGGDVFQWNESVIANSISGFAGRGGRGGSFDTSNSFYITSPWRVAGDPTADSDHVGFRAAYVPEPSAVLLAALAWGSLWCWRKWFT